MPAPVHAVIVTRTATTSLARLLRTVDAVTQQTLAPRAITVVVCGPDEAVRSSPTVLAAATDILTMRSGAGLAAAWAHAVSRIDPDHAVWLLSHDAVPDPGALAELAGALERSPSATLAAPKLVDDEDPGTLVSFGQSLTRYGRTIDLAHGQLDQGQHDALDDVLGADARGLLVRAGHTRTLIPDAALAAADEGLDMGVRARVAGGRVAPASAARVRVPRGDDRATAGNSYARRRSQLHRRLAYAPWPATVPHWLSLLPLALIRSIVHLVAKRPAAVLPEWAAAGMTMVSIVPVVRARARLRRNRSAGWSSVTPLRVTGADLRQTLDDGHTGDDTVRHELGFFSGGGAWAVLVALVLGVAAFFTMLAWPALGGGALLPLRQTVGALWSDAAYGLRGSGTELVGPADPFAAVVAVLGSLWPASPSYALVLLWVLALPLAMLGGWFAATRLTERPGLRIVAGTVWMLAPTFVTALMHGRPTAVIVHLLLPWLFHSALVAHRSWGAAGAASLLAAAIVACAPSLAPALLVMWLLALGIAFGHKRLHGAVRVFWTVVPAVIMAFPLIVRQARDNNLWGLLADPGRVWAGPQAGADAAGRAQILAGYPAADTGGWPALLGSGAEWALWLAVPLVVVALAAALSPRWAAGAVALAVAALGMATALGSVGIVVAFDALLPVAIWPGSALSLAWAGLLAAAVLTLDTVKLPSGLRVTAISLIVVSILMAAAPTLAAFSRGDSELRNGPSSTLPAYVGAQARDDRDLGTLTLTPQSDGGLAVAVVWGASRTLGAQTTLLSTATQPTDPHLATLAVDLVSSRDFDAPAALEIEAIGFVLLDRAAGDESDRARERRLESENSLDRRAGFVRVGETDKGTLWRVEAEPTTRAGMTPTQQATARLVVTVQLAAILIALLLAVPTRASRRAARGRPRVVGLRSHNTIGETAGEQEELAAELGSDRSGDDSPELAEPEPEAKSQAEVEPEPEADPELQAEPASEPESQPEPEREPEPELEPEPDLEPEPELEQAPSGEANDLVEHEELEFRDAPAAADDQNPAWVEQEHPESPEHTEAIEPPELSGTPHEPTHGEEPQR